MYSVNSLALDNTTYGWKLRAPSQPLSELVRSVVSLRLPSRDGVVPGLPAPIAPVPLKFVVETPRANLETLYALWANPPLVLTMTADSTRSVDIELLSLNPEGFGNADAIVDVTAMVRIPAAFWRSASVTTSTLAALSSASVNVDVLTGISAPVSDAIVRVRGAATTIRVADSRGSWFTAPDLAAGNYVRFDAATGEAFTTASDTWTGGTDVSGSVSFGGPRGFFEITPYFSAPQTRTGRLTVTTATRSNAGIEVRGRTAHLIF